MADRDDNHVIAPWKHQFGKLGHLTKYWNYLYVVNGYITTLISNAITATTGTITTLSSTTGTITTLNSTTATIGTLNVTTVNSPIVLPVHRSKFIYKDADEIYIDPGCYYHLGTSEQNIYWNSQLTFQFQNLANSDWSYLYLDDSAIVTLGAALITATELIDSTTEPTYSNTKHGWYNGEDKCIFAVLTDGSSNILEFFHMGGNFVLLADDIQNYTGKPSGTWTDVTLSGPKFSQDIDITIWTEDSDVEAIIQWRTNGQSGGYGHNIVAAPSGGYAAATAHVITDSSNRIEVRLSTSSSNLDVFVYTNGWYFPDTV